VLPHTIGPFFIISGHTVLSRQSLSGQDGLYAPFHKLFCCFQASYANAPHLFIVLISNRKAEKLSHFPYEMRTQTNPVLNDLFLTAPPAGYAKKRGLPRACGANHRCFSNSCACKLCQKLLCPSAPSLLPLNMKAAHSRLNGRIHLVRHSLL